MKVKQRPEDFIVSEIGAFKPGRAGKYAVYQLAKSGIGTIEALNAITRAWDIKRQAISAGGLKDRHAKTEQLISIYQGPKLDLKQNLFELKYLGQADQPISPASFTANRFTICLRDLSKPEVVKVKERLDEVARYGLANYFDEQRFGSVRGGGEFIAKQLIRRDYEGALKTALTATSAEDPKEVRDIRQTILTHWGNWPECFKHLPRSSERSIINYLRDHPANFRQAFELLDPNLAILYLHAYQSYIWNKALARLLTNHINKEHLIRLPYMLGEFVFHQSLPDDALKNLEIPFVHHKAVWPNDEIAGIFAELLKPEGVEQSEFCIRGMVKTYFRKGNRRAIIFPQGLSVKPAEPDELNRDKQKLAMEFALPRGAYATIVIKRVSYDF